MFLFILVANTNTHRQKSDLEYFSKCFVELLKECYLPKVEYRDLVWKSSSEWCIPLPLLLFLIHVKTLHTTFQHCQHIIISSGSWILKNKSFLLPKRWMWRQVTRGYQQFSCCCHSCLRAAGTSILNNGNGGIICINSLAWRWCDLKSGTLEECEAWVRQVMYNLSDRAALNSTLQTILNKKSCFVQFSAFTMGVNRSLLLLVNWKPTVVSFHLLRLPFTAVKFRKPNKDSLYWLFTNRAVEME